MKRFFTISTLSLLVLPAIFSCGSADSKIPASKHDYIGNWQSENMHIEITKGGHIDYKKQKGTGTTSISAPISRFKGDDFEVGAFGLTTLFDVTQKPHKEDGIWKMTVDGVELTRE